MNSKAVSSWCVLNSHLLGEGSATPTSTGIVFLPPWFYPRENSLGVRGQIQERPYFLTGLIPFVTSKCSLHAKQDVISVVLVQRPSQCWSLGFGSFLLKVKGKEFFILKSVTLRVSKAISGQCLRDRYLAHCGPDPKLFQVWNSLSAFTKACLPVACSDSS